MAEPGQTTPTSPPAGNSPAVSKTSNIDLPGESLSGLRRLVGREKSKGTFDSLGSLKNFGEEAMEAATETALEESALEKIRSEDILEEKNKAYAGMVAVHREEQKLKGGARTEEENERLSALNRSQQSFRRSASAPKQNPAALSRTSMFDEIANRTGNKPGESPGFQAATASKSVSGSSTPPKTNNEQQAAQQLQGQQQQKRLEQTKQELLAGSGIDEQKQKAQEEIRKQMKAAIRRGAEEAAQGIGNAIDIGTVGISTIVTVLIYAFTLVDLNLQMASFYLKNKTFDFFFPSLTWSPIPMPSIVSPRFLHAGLVVLDLLVLALLVVGFSVIIVTTLLPYMIAVGGVAVLWELAGDPGLRAQVYDLIKEFAFH